MESDIRHRTFDFNTTEPLHKVNNLEYVYSCLSNSSGPTIIDFGSFFPRLLFYLMGYVSVLYLRTTLSRYNYKIFKQMSDILVLAFNDCLIISFLLNWGAIQLFKMKRGLLLLFFKDFS